MKPRLSVIIPAYNEAKNLNRGKLDQVYKYLKAKYQSDFEMILADDGSTDETGQRLISYAQTKPEVRVLSLPHRGKGPTVAAAMLKAKGENRLFTDFDQSTPIEELEKLMVKRSEGFDIAIGSREIMGAKREAEPWYRHIMGKVFNGVVRVLTVRGIMDTQCGFKMFSAKATEQIFNQLKSTVKPRKDAFTGAFDVEVLFLARKMGYRTAEVPVHWQHVKTVRVNPLKDSVRMFAEVVMIRLTDLMGGYRF